MSFESFESSISVEYYKEIDCRLATLCDVYNRDILWFTAQKSFENNDSLDLCEGGWEINDEYRIGDPSSNGMVYEGECKSHPHLPDRRRTQYAIKVILLSQRNTLNMFIDEVNWQQKIYKKTLAMLGTPYTTPIYQVFLGTDIVMCVTDLLNISVYGFITNIFQTHNQLTMQQIEKISEIIRKCRNIILDLIIMGIYHGDGHLKNFMFTREGYELENIKIIDFGKTRETRRRGIFSLDTIEEDDYLIVLNFVKWYSDYKHHLRSIMAILKYSDIPEKDGLNVLTEFVDKNGHKTANELMDINDSIPKRIIQANNEDDDEDDEDEYVFPSVPVRK